jgi:non-ribosomal peptide synthetase component F
VLASKGVAAGSTIGIMLERSLELIIAILGVLKAGGESRLMWQ